MKCCKFISCLMNLGLRKRKTNPHNTNVQPPPPPIITTKKVWYWENVPETHIEGGYFTEYYENGRKIRDDKLPHHVLRYSWCNRYVDTSPDESELMADRQAERRFYVNGKIIARTKPTKADVAKMPRCGLQYNHDTPIEEQDLDYSYAEDGHGNGRSEGEDGTDSNDNSGGAA